MSTVIRLHRSTCDSCVSLVVRETSWPPGAKMSTYTLKNSVLFSLHYADPQSSAAWTRHIEVETSDQTSWSVSHQARPHLVRNIRANLTDCVISD